MRAVKNLMMPVMHSVTLDIEGCIKYLFICIGRFLCLKSLLSWSMVTPMPKFHTHTETRELQLSELAARAPYFTDTVRYGLQ